MVLRSPQLIIALLTSNFEYAFKVRVDRNRTQDNILAEVDCNISWRRQVSSGTKSPSAETRLTVLLLGYKYPRGHMVHQQRHLPKGYNN